MVALARHALTMADTAQVALYTSSATVLTTTFITMLQLYGERLRRQADRDRALEERVAERQAVHHAELRAARTRMSDAVLELAATARMAEVVRRRGRPDESDLDLVTGRRADADYRSANRAIEEFLAAVGYSPEATERADGLCDEVYRAYRHAIADPMVGDQRSGHQVEAELHRLVRNVGAVPGVVTPSGDGAVGGGAVRSPPRAGGPPIASPPARRWWPRRTTLPDGSQLLR